MKPSITIHPKEACECAHPLPDITYYGIQRCKLCEFLIPRTRLERAALREQRHDLEVREGMWPATQPTDPIDRRKAMGLVKDALAGTPELTNGQLREMIQGHGRMIFGNTVWAEVCRDSRAALGIHARKGRRPNCVTIGCVNPQIGVHGYCKKCLEHRGL